MRHFSTTVKAGAETAIQLLEYANSQFAGIPPLRRVAYPRTGDCVRGLWTKGQVMLARWRLARAATKLHTVLLDVK